MRTMLGALLLAPALMLAGTSTGSAAGPAGPAFGQQSALNKALPALVEKVHRRRGYRYHRRHYRRPRVYFNYGWAPFYYGYYRTYYARRYYYRRPAYRHYRHRHYRRHW
ncbi:MAG: hypothetical protein R3D67_06090 [Hyphomicrobiaceae bacterium]